MASEDINELIYQLNNDDDWEVRQKAADRLALRGPEAADALDALWNGIAVEDDEDVLESIAEAITSIEKDRSVLLTKLSESTEQIRNYDNIVDSEFFLTFARKVRFQPSELEGFLDAVWKHLESWNERDDLSEARTIIFELTTDGAAALERLVTAEGIDPRKKSYLLLDYNFRDHLDRSWKGVRERLLPLVLTALSNADSDTRDEAADWLGTKASSFTAEERDEALEALWDYLHENSRGIGAITRFGDRAAAVQQLLSDGEVERSDAGGMLLMEAPDALVELWEKDRKATLGIVLAALELEGWDERQASVNWLVNYASEFSEAESAEVLEALWICLRTHGQGFNAIMSVGDRTEAIERLISDAEVKKSRAGAILLMDAEDELNNLLERDKGKAPKLVLAALEDDDWTVRQTAAEWLRGNGGEFKREQVDTAVQSLEQLLETEYDPDVQRSIDAALVNFRKLQRGGQLGPLKDILQDKDEERMPSLRPSTRC